MSKRILSRGWMPLLLALAFGAAAAAPTAPTVVAGQASFSQQGNVFSITNTPGAIIHWQSFSIGAGEVTRFIQQSADSAVLNRITGQDPSRILGALQSNGKVFLINPNGILFGRDARVDVNGLVASSLNLSNADFLAGRHQYSAGASAGAVRNEGTISTPAGGQVYLLAPDVHNSGVITTPQGEVVLAAGHRVQLVDGRDPDLHVVVSAPASAALNLGQVVAQGGRIGIYGALVNQRGVLNADSAVVGANGKIVLKASRDTVLDAGSVTSATGAGRGGEIHLLGERVGLAGNAAVDASGATGGGAVLVGGDAHGANAAVPNARQTWMGAQASIRADATEHGDGGKVVLWSDGATGVHGSVSARGGAAGGNGGFVETSGHDLDLDGARVHAGAAAGKAGTWLLDPYDIEVVETSPSASAADVATFGAGAASGVTRVVPSVLLATGADIVLQARHDLSFNSALAATRGIRAQAGNDINVNAALSSSSGAVSLSAVHALTLANAGSLASPLAIDLKADQMYLRGQIGSAASPAQVVSFTTYGDTRPLVVAAAPAGGQGDALLLDTAALAGVKAQQISLGSGAHSGSISVAAPLATSANLVLDNAGAIQIGAALDLRTGNGRFAANLFGDGGAIAVTPGGSIQAGKSVLLQGDTVQLQGAVSAPAVTLTPHRADSTGGMVIGADNADGFAVSAASLRQISTDKLTLAAMPGQLGPVRVAGAVDLTQGGRAPTLVIDAGASSLEIAAPLTAGGTVVLKSDASISEAGSGAVTASALLASGGEGVSLGGANRIGTVAASSAGNVELASSGDLHVGSVAGASGVQSAGGALRVRVSGGELVLDQGIDAGSGAVTLEGASIGGAGLVRGAALQASATGGIGAAGAALHTQVAALSAQNTQAGTAPINISNTGDVVVSGVVQAAPREGSNGGDVTISTRGRMEVANPSPGASLPLPASGAGVSTGSGQIALTSSGDMLVSGRIASGSGNIVLEAQNGARLTVQAGAQLASVSGAVTVRAGPLAIAEGAVQVANPSKFVAQNNTPGQQPPTPTLDACLANGALAGCGPVLDQAKQACIANLDGPNCAKLLPTVAECKLNGAAAGCEAVLARDALLQCAANPAGAGCAQVLPSYEVCVKSPAALGCAAVLQQRQQLDACIANPGAAGCAAILPTYDLCVAKPSTYGCGPALDEHNRIAACVANPAAAGCAAILPTYDMCVAKPATFGCGPAIDAHNRIAACIADPKAAGCASVLPPLATCQADAGVFGCVPVLARARFEACLANPAGAGCAAVLPSLDVCKITPALEGCSVVIKQTFDMCLVTPQDARCNGVLPTVAQCVADGNVAGCSVVLKRTFEACLLSPHDAQCVGVLPSLSQCVATPGLSGCAVVLPTLNECVGSPTLQGCSAVLPPLSACAANPALAGCTAVLPKPDDCTANPGAPVCQTITPGSGGSGSDSASAPVTVAINQTIDLINRSTPSTPVRTPAPVAGGGGSAPPASQGAAATGSGNGSGESNADQPASPRSTGPAATDNSGVKNEKPIVKTYCN